MAMTPALFKMEYNQFASMPDTMVQAAIDRFGCLYQGDYGCQADYLTGLWVAHHLYMNSRKGGAPVGVATGKTVGDTSIQYAHSSSAASAGNFAASKWGLEFSSLMSMYGAGPMITRDQNVFKDQAY